MEVEDLHSDAQRYPRRTHDAAQAAFLWGVAIASRVAGDYAYNPEDPGQDPRKWKSEWKERAPFLLHGHVADAARTWLQKETGATSSDDTYRCLDLILKAYRRAIVSLGAEERK